MIINNVAIKAVSHYTSDNILSSEEIESELSPIYDRLKLPYGRLELMTGIKQRRIWDSGTKPSDLSFAAAKQALSEANFPVAELDLIIHSSVCRDFLEPATASVVHSLLKAPAHCQFFDLSNACLGMLNAMVVAASMIENKLIRNALIVSGENSTPLIEQTFKALKSDSDLTRKSIKKYFANLTIGSAATAMLLCPSDDAKNAPKIIGGASFSDSSVNHLCRGSGDTHSLMMETDSEKLMDAGIPLALKTFKQCLKNTQLKPSDINWAISHQVGVAHQQALNKALEIQQIKTYLTYPLYGNTGSSAIPLSLSLLQKSQQIKKEDYLALLGIGSGLSSLMLVLKY